MSFIDAKCGQIQSMSTTVLFAVLLALTASAQQPQVRVTGKVKDQTNMPFEGVAVTLREKASNIIRQTTTDSTGAFELPAEAGDDAEITASEHGRTAQVYVTAARLAEPVDLVLSSTSAADAGKEMNFSDDPHFTVAGVTDWTAVGGHGSDSTLRSSESLAHTTASLPSAGASAGVTTAEELRLEREVRDGESKGHTDRAQARVHAALRRHPTATLYRLAAEVDEGSGNPLLAVREFEQAAKLEVSETNEFEWGAELLVHRAIWQAEAVFQRGVSLYPASVRMQVALGTALFAGARYEEAADRLCKASDLAPSEEAPYLILGKVELAAPRGLTCVEPRLERFVQLKPESGEARYLQAMAILKPLGSAPDANLAANAEGLLKKSVELDAMCNGAYLELGILAAQRGDLPMAIQYYEQAIAADPMMADAYYRLAKAYERTGKGDQAKAAFVMHDQVARTQAEAAERRRKAVKQFLFANTGEPSTATP